MYICKAIKLKKNLFIQFTKHKEAENNSTIFNKTHLSDVFVPANWFDINKLDPAVGNVMAEKDRNTGPRPINKEHINLRKELLEKGGLFDDNPIVN